MECAGSVLIVEVDEELSDVETLEVTEETVERSTILVSYVSISGISDSLFSGSISRSTSEIMVSKSA